MGGSEDLDRTEVTEDYVAELERVSWAVERVSMDAVAGIEEIASATHLRALRTLEELGGTHVSDLARALDVQPSTASRLSDRLTAAGLITREASAANRRATRLELTPAGCDVLADLARVRGDALADVARAMPPRARAALLEGLRGFATALESPGVPEDSQPTLDEAAGAPDASPPGPRPAAVDAVRARLVDELLDVAPDESAQRAVDVLRDHLDVGWVQLWLVDRQQRVLHPVAACPGPVGEPASVRGTPGGRAVLEGAVVQEGPGGVVNVPLSARGCRVGVLVLATRPAPDRGLLRLGGVLAMLLLDADRATDGIEVARRTYDFSINAELQWQLLPASDLQTPHADVHALIEPATLVSTDLFDHSLTGGRLWVAGLVANGRGIAAAQTADLAVVALRHARRLGRPLAEHADLANQALLDRYRHRGHAAAVLVDVDTVAATAQAVAAGPATLLRRREGRVEPLPLTEQELLGLSENDYVAHVLDLAPGDVLLLASPGVIACADEHGESFGTERLAAIFADSPAGDVCRRVVEALRAWSSPLSADASLICVDWHDGRR